MTIHFGDSTSLTTAPDGGSDVQVFTSDGTWSKPSSGTHVHVYVWGAGGGGGGNTNFSGGLSLIHI